MDQIGMPENFQSSYLEDLVRQHDRDRYVIAMFAPPSVRAALMTLLAFNVEVARIRETVSEPLIGQMRLQWWRDVIQTISDGGDAPQGHPVAESLASLIKSEQLDTRRFATLINAREADMLDQPPENLAGLTDYCGGTSGEFHTIAMSLLSDVGEPEIKAAHLAGTAWALTGLVRATPILAAVNRSMLPQDLMRREGLEIQDLQKPESAGDLHIIVQEITDIASALIADTRTLSPEISASARRLLLNVPQTEAYLSVIAKANYDIYDSRVAMARPAVAKLWWHAWRKSY